MADTTSTITVATFEQIATLLSKLSNNYTSMANTYYDMFYNTEAMDIEVKIYDAEGSLITYTIPNRAKDMEFLKNGEGSPEGEIQADKGTLYQDTINGVLYIKQFNADTNGWVEIKSGQEILTGAGSPEGLVEATKGSLYTDTENAVVYIKTTTVGSKGWELISVSTTILANTSLDNLTEDGENHFANLDLTNLSTEGQSVIDNKENVVNKVYEITSLSTDNTYPSTKSVYDYVLDKTSALANQDLDNLTSTGKLHFLGSSQMLGCIVTAQTLLSTDGSNTLSLYENTELVCPSGLEDDNRLKNVRRILAETKVKAVPFGVEVKRGLVFYSFLPSEGAYTNLDQLLYCEPDKFFISTTQPNIPEDEVAVWFNPNTNYTYTANVSYTSSSVLNTWQLTQVVYVGEFSTTSSGVVATVTPRKPFVAQEKISITYDL